MGEPHPTPKPRLLQINTHELSAKKFLPHLMPLDIWYWGTAAGEHLGVHIIKFYLYRNDLAANRAQNVYKTDPLSRRSKSPTAETYHRRTFTRPRHYPDLNTTCKRRSVKKVSMIMSPPTAPAAGLIMTCSNISSMNVHTPLYVTRYWPNSTI